MTAARVLHECDIEEKRFSREDDNGNLYYNHNPIAGKGKAPDSELSTPPYKGGAGTEADASAQTQSTFAQDVNLEFSVDPEDTTTNQLRPADQKAQREARERLKLETTDIPQNPAPRSAQQRTSRPAHRSTRPRLI